MWKPSFYVSVKFGAQYKVEMDNRRNWFFKWQSKCTSLSDSIQLNTKIII